MEVSLVALLLALAFGRKPIYCVILGVGRATEIVASHAC
jgi:hypothetical protein